MYASNTLLLSAALLLGSSALPTDAKPLYKPWSEVGLTARQAGVIAPNRTVSIDPAFPTNVGYAGTTQFGQAPFLALTDKINSTDPRPTTPYESRYKAAESQNSTFDILQYLGNTSPYFPSPLFADFQAANRQLNETCTLKSVHILHRHGDRYPTSYSTEGAPFFGAVVANATRNASAPGAEPFITTGPLSFLTNWTYELGAEVLTPSGAQELFDSGVKAYYNYGRLYNATTSPKPVVRTTSQQRMLDSARYWTAGFFGLDAPNLVNLEVILEGDGFNNTLASYDTCNNSNTVTVGDEYLTPVWEEVYLNKTVPRLQQYIQSGLNLTTKMVYGMQSLCAYETVGLGYSSFCELFTAEEWRGFEYFLDLQFQGDYGYMSPSGKAQGIGYVQELLARLTGTPIAPANITTQNSTLLSDKYLPLNQTLNVDFTHDDIILSVLTSLSYDQVAGDYLPADTKDDNRTFYLSHITPFAARLIFEVADCPSATNPGANDTILRTILNDALIPMDERQGCTTKRSDGSCLLSEFVAFQQEHAYKDANFDFACFAKNGTDFTITGPTVRNGTIA